MIVLYESMPGFGVRVRAGAKRVWILTGQCREEVGGMLWSELRLPAGIWSTGADRTIVALEKAKTEKEAHGEFESEHPGYCGAQDTYYVGNLKGVGRVLPANLYRHLC
jgi:hypothetical protein